MVIKNLVTLIMKMIIILTVEKHAVTNTRYSFAYMTLHTFNCLLIRRVVIRLALQGESVLNAINDARIYGC